MEDNQNRKKNDDFCDYGIENTKSTNHAYDNPAFTIKSESGNELYENPKVNDSLKFV